MPCFSSQQSKIKRYLVCYHVKKIKAPNPPIWEDGNSESSHRYYQLCSGGVELGLNTLALHFIHIFKYANYIVIRFQLSNVLHIKHNNQHRVFFSQFLDSQTCWRGFPLQSFPSCSSIARRCQNPRKPGLESTQTVSPEPRSITLGPPLNKCLVTLQHQLEFKEVFKRPILYSNIIAHASKSLE